MNKIYKTIHYCWFGKKELPAKERKCIETWKKYLPDFEIIEWNEDNFDIKSCLYVKQAYEDKNYAFVSDYARFKILYLYGGVYLDTDVELIKEIDDLLLEGPFMGVEEGLVDMNKNFVIAPGLGMYAIPGMELYKVIISAFESRVYINENHEVDRKNVCQFIGEIMDLSDLKIVNGIGESNGIKIYPKDYFCPKDYVTGRINITKNTRAIHHYSGLWMTKYDKKMLVLFRNFINKYGEQKGRKLAEIVSVPDRFAHNIKILGILKTLKKIPRKIFK